jgi:UDP-N-acetyl-D-mannosaminuronic acid dehydrogenase
VEALAGQPGATIAILGLAFKANIDDVRESPSVTIVEELVRQLPDSTILVVDPNVEEPPVALTAQGISRLHAMEEAVAAADLVLLLVDHDEFLVIDPESLEGKQVIDTKGIWNHSEPVDSAKAHVPVGAGASG